ncbi:MAG TPA: glycosyltransferase family 4 protein, partial [Candidatus Thermoplasmatota archaeon]|nr:glycosyltransferase family 4 protein [Candidatus Thermoplasmatota archaeon]
APIAHLDEHIGTDTDLVQVPATYPFTTGGVLRRAKRDGVPSVLDFHFEPDPGHAVGRAAAVCYRQLGPRTYSLADAVVVRSLAYGRSAPSLKGIPEEAWRPIPNGIDPTVFHADVQSLPHLPGPYLLFVGRLVPYKGLDVLLHALARHKPGMPLVVAGDGPLRTRLEELARRLQVDVIWLGYVKEEELPGLYKGAALTVLPSVNRQEAFGICLLESMACGTPVVATSLPGVADVASFGGYVARTGDPVSLSAQVRAALQADHLDRGRRLSERVHATFSWDAVTQRFLAVYEEVLQSRAPGGTSPLAHPLRHPVLPA